MTGSSTTLRPTVRLLDDAQVDRIIEEACRVLELVGVMIEYGPAAELVAGAGATRREGRWMLPERLVRDAVGRAPQAVSLFDRAGRLALQLEGDRVHFDPGSAAIWLIDPGTRRRREIVSSDLLALGRLVEGLPHYHAQSTALTPADVPKEIADRFRLYVALQTCSKPVITGTFLRDAFGPMREMLEAVRGGSAALAQKPLAIFDCCATAPLRWPELTCESLLECARRRIPAEVISVPMTGATSPVTLRESIVQHCAENLAGIAMHQLAGPGAPVIYGGSPTAFDMRHGTTPMGAIESMMIDVANAQVGKRLGLPVHAYMGLSDSKTVDYQAGAESGIGTILAALAGVNVVSGPGMLDFESTQSLEKLVLDHEVCGLALRFVRGVQEREVDVLGLFGELVGKGDLLAHPHTRKHWRDELTVVSSLIDRKTYGDWEVAGAQTSWERASHEVSRRLTPTPGLAPGPGLSPEALSAVRDIMRSEAARVGFSTLPC